MVRKGPLVLAVVLGVLVGVSVAADAIGVGSNAFGWEQKLGVLAGTSITWFAALRLAGWSPGRRRKRSREHVSQQTTARTH